MATKKRKRLDVETVRAELELLAFGANGAPVETCEEWPTLVTAMPSWSVVNLVRAVKNRWFDDTPYSDVWPLSMTQLDDWDSLDTLTDAIVRERERLDSLARCQAQSPK